MRLKSVWIGDYKNLHNFSLTFDGNSFLDVFVGKNGTGKSNFFEALIEIFRHIYDSTNELDAISFDYEISYEIEGTETTIAFRGEVLTINGRERKTVGRTPVPDNVLVYYSGHNDTIATLIKRYETTFRRRIRGAEVGESRKFIGVGPEYKQLLLSILLMQPVDCQARDFIQEKLKIEILGTETNLVLSRPRFAEGMEVDPFDAGTFLWGIEGIVRDFLDKLLGCIKDEYTPGSLYDRDADQFSIPINLDLFRTAFEKVEPSELFRSFDNIRTLEMIKDISVPITLEGGIKATTGHFSDGQFQSIYIYSISELFKDRNCVSLLDEPDSFLHPEWQFDFLKQVTEITGAASQSNHVLLSSHSASTIARTSEEDIRMFEFDGDFVTIHSSNRSAIIRSLSAGLITFSETEARLNISFILKNTTRPILFTEGITDELILETAWQKLRDGVQRPFEIQNAFSCGFLRNLLKEQNLYDSNPGRKFLGLFDFDEAYNDWVQLGADFETDPTKCLGKKLNGREGYAMLLPVPQNPHIRQQVLNSDTGGHYANRSLLTIELLLYGVPGLNAYFEIDQSRPERFTRFIGDKVHFATDVVPTVSAEHFAAFKPIFESIEGIVGPAV
ncbi:AAA family ATPase [Sneathiella chungangensis]|uniref:AAA family ATPase n=1 Tax=Sneathiella chungangensis TaxID=1418234 RepID=A0A845MKT6_9PROT|nr:AAA family ATPase [Sneathiella chungangensis]MZR23940.1 AAA family ATPase [Sneathiella chungangensis]